MPNQLTLKSISLCVGALLVGACAAATEPVDEEQATQDVLGRAEMSQAEDCDDSTTESNPPPPPSDESEGTQVCGNEADLHCCNSLVEQADGGTGLGILTDLLGNVSLGSGCTPILSISQCSQKVACCDSSTSQEGLININALNCVQVPLL